MKNKNVLLWMYCNTAVTFLVFLFNYAVSKTLTVRSYKYVKLFDIWYAVGMVMFLSWGLQILFSESYNF